MKANYQLIIFDWDGTLVDSSSAIVGCIQKAAAELELPMPEYQAIKQIIGLGLRQAYSLLFPTAIEKFDAFHRRYLHYSLLAVPYKEILFSGVRELLLALKQQGFLLAVATGKNRLGLNAALNELELNTLFATSRTADETFSKPHPQMVLEILDELMIMPEQTLLVGDTVYDMQLAKNAGIEAIAVTCGVHTVDQLLSHQPLVCLKETRELLNWLNN